MLVPNHWCKVCKAALACASFIAAIALLEVSSAAEPPPPFLPPQASQPAPQPASPADKATLPRETADAIVRADKGDKEDLPRARKELIDFVAKYPEDLGGLQLLARAYELSPAPADRQAGASPEDFVVLAQSTWLKTAAVAVQNANTPNAYQEAARLCDQILRRGPAMWPANLELARLHARHQRGSQAVDRYTAYLKACRDAKRVDTEACLELARLHLAMYRWRLAVQVLLEAGKDDAANPEIDAVLAQAYRMGADPAAKRADEVKDENRFEQRQLLTEAVNAIEEALKKAPRNHDYLLAKVGIRGARNLNDDKNKDLDEATNAACLAVRLTAEALQEKPGDGRLLAQLSRSYDALGATLIARLQRDKDDAATLVHLTRMARRHTDIQREISLRQLGHRLGFVGEKARNAPAAKALIEEIESQLREIRAGAIDLPLATHPAS